MNGYKDIDSYNYSFTDEECEENDEKKQIEKNNSDLLQDEKKYDSLASTTAIAIASEWYMILPSSIVKHVVKSSLDILAEDIEESAVKRKKKPSLKMSTSLNPLFAVADDTNEKDFNQTEQWEDVDIGTFTFVLFCVYGMHTTFVLINICKSMGHFISGNHDF